MADHGKSTHSTLVHPLRLVLIASYLPAIPLSIVHGVLAQQPVPALGLLPLTFSFISSVAIYRLRENILQYEEDRHQEAHGDADDNDGLDDADTSRGARLRAAITHPISVFAFDLVLAAAFMIVLVFTWIGHSAQSGLSMLAAYVTIPLLLSFFVHLALAAQALADGLALHGLIRWTAWRAVPADCPHCNVRLRPSLPTLPWLKSFQRRRRGGGGGGRYHYTPILTDDREQYTDDVEGTAGAAGVADQQPEAVEVRKKERKGKTGTPQAGGETPWDT